MNRSRPCVHSYSVPAVLLGAALLLGCGSDETSHRAGDDMGAGGDAGVGGGGGAGDDAAVGKDAGVGGGAGAGGGSGSDGGRGGPGAETEPSFAIHSQIFNPEGATNLVHAVRSLEDLETLDPAEALEIPGYPDIAGYMGSVFVAEGEAPVIARYDVTQDGFEAGDTVSFMNKGMDPGDPGAFVDETKAYAFDPGAATQLATWNPEDMKTMDEIEIEAIEPRDGFSRIRASSPMVRDGKLLQSFFWQNSDAVEFSEDTQLAVIDIETDAVDDVQGETRCPVLNKLTRAEDGTLYLSTWLYSPVVHHMFDAPSTCAVRIPAGSTTIDPDWALDFEALTGGRQAAELHYVGDGMATLSVFHHERVDIENAESPWSLAGTKNWKVWLVDLEERTAEPLDALGWSAGDHVAFRHDGRLLILLPTTEDWETTVVWEISPDGSTRQMFESDGWVKRIATL